MFGRSKESTAEASASASASTELASRAGGKGRATPKRREAEKGRRRAITAPKDRKQAYREARGRQRDERKVSMQALRTGDERHLPPRDRGPVKRYARDIVDARRSVAEFFLPLAVVILLLTYAGSDWLKTIGSTLWLALVVLIVIDSVLLARRLKKGLARSHPAENHRGALPYALMRSMQIRKFRLPPPRIKAGSRRP
ncbi:MAG: DUF3043 domain-containing protein [Spirochaetaceae bacterium]|nr:DUF3043 domain-containing protein [Spirochaetaceae bacterium]